MSNDEFQREFLKTLAAGVLPTSQFIDWVALDAVVSDICDEAGPIASIRARMMRGESLRDAVEDALLREHDPSLTVTQLFYLLGHTRPVFVSQEYELDLKALAKRLRSRDSDAAGLIADALIAAGIGEVLRATSIRDLAAGIRIGLDTHRRKSTGGAAFGIVIDSVLDDVARDLAAWGITLQKHQEYTVSYGTGLAKTVDFAMCDGATAKVVFEINFYTAGGSKPSEVARAYSELSRKFESLGIVFVWITDGQGWRGMQNVVREMPLQVPNVYNTRQAREYLADDLRRLLSDS